MSESSFAKLAWDRKILEAEREHAAADAAIRVIPGRYGTVIGFEKEREAFKKLEALRRQRVTLAEAPVAPAVAAAQPAPRRMSDRADKVSLLPAWLPGLEHEAREKIIDAAVALTPAILADIENEIEGWQTGFPSDGQEVKLTQSTYKGLIAQFVKLNGDVRILGNVVDYLIGELAAKTAELASQALGDRSKAGDDFTVLRARLNRIEGELRDNPLPKYVGVWRTGLFKKNTFCTHHGSLWIATAPTTSTPGDPVGAWQLAVKRGSDGKDAK